MLLVTVAVLAAQPANTPPGSPAATDFSKAIIAFVTASVVFLIGKIPWIPRPLLPALTPFLGVVFGLLGNALASVDLSWFDAAMAGAAGVFSREVVNQTITKKVKNMPEATKTNAFPVDGAVAVDGRFDSTH